MQCFSVELIYVQLEISVVISMLLFIVSFQTLQNYCLKRSHDHEHQKHHIRKRFHVSQLSSIFSFQNSILTLNIQAESARF